MKTLAFAIVAIMVSGSVAFAAMNEQVVTTPAQPEEPDTTQVAQPAQPEEPTTTPQTPSAE